QPRELGATADVPDQFGDTLGTLVLLVAVKGDEISDLAPVQHGRDRLKPEEISIGLAAHFELEIAVTISLDPFLQRLGEPVADTLPQVRSSDRVDETHRVARLDRSRGSQLP